CGALRVPRNGGQAEIQTLADFAVRFASREMVARRKFKPWPILRCASRPAEWWPRAELNHRHKDFQSRPANKSRLTTTRSHMQINRLQFSMCCTRSPSVVVICPEVSHQCPMGQCKQKRSKNGRASVVFAKL